ncbi:ABC transporter permease [Desulfitibacter alkalitolerans]|uniref:ABC transporter permease n=1 Tax=Desulfitibacter alkalitolerans TaxID=264641 RepID=UPI0006866740|nr:ABC transporter permease [Desulfitibacter alkalitolerans]
MQTRFILQRLRSRKLIQYLILIILIVTMNFLLPRLLPGNPLAFLVGEEAWSLTSAEKEAVLEKYHLNKPLLVQYLYYLKDLVTFNWGDSYTKKQPITQVLWAAVPWTLLLAFSNLLIASVLGSFLGAMAALKRKSRLDVNLLLVVSFISSAPSFWIGMILISVFAVKLDLFPIYGAYSLWTDYTGLARVYDILWHLFLPLATLVILSLSGFFLTMRYSLLEVLGEDFVLMARAKGLSDKIIKYRYIMRNALLPVFTIFMMDLGYIFSGAIVVETVFSYPGIGRIMYEAVIARDYPLLQYSFLLISLMVILANYIADLIYPIIDPRVVKENAAS